MTSRLYSSVQTSTTSLATKQNARKDEWQWWQKDSAGLLDNGLEIRSLLAVFIDRLLMFISWTTFERSERLGQLGRLCQLAVFFLFVFFLSSLTSSFVFPCLPTFIISDKWIFIGSRWTVNNSLFKNLLKCHSLFFKYHFHSVWLSVFYFLLEGWWSSLYNTNLVRGCKSFCVIFGSLGIYESSWRQLTFPRERDETLFPPSKKKG